MAETSSQPATPEEIAEVIAEFEQYRERLVNDTMSAAKKAKLSKKKTMAQLEPQLAKIDATLEKLRSQQGVMGDDN